MASKNLLRQVEPSGGPLMTDYTWPKIDQTVPLMTITTAAGPISILCDA